MSSLAQLDLLHLEPGAIGLEPPVEHPLGLVLLGRDEADRVFVEALGRELLLDVGGEAPFVVGALVGRLLGLAVPDGLVVIAPAFLGEAGQADALERAAHRVADDAHVRLDPAVRVERAVVVARRRRSMVMRDRPFDRLDDVGEADRRRPAARARSRRRRRARWSAGREPRAGPSASARSAAARRSRSTSSVALRRAPAGAAGGGGHQHDRIIGKVGQAHVLIRSFPVRFRRLQRRNSTVAALTGCRSAAMT